MDVSWKGVWLGSVREIRIKWRRGEVVRRLANALLLLRSVVRAAYLKAVSQRQLSYWATYKNGAFPPMLAMYNEFIPPSFSSETAYRNRSLVMLWSLRCVSHLSSFFLHAGFEDTL